MKSSTEITELLIDWSKGNQEALEKLFPVVEKELHRLAHNYMGKMRSGFHTLQTTAIINETYIQLIKLDKIQWQNRAHFFAICAIVMRQFLLNYIRSGKKQKRGGGLQRVEIEEDIIAAGEKTAEIIALEEALCRLEKFDKRKAKVVELRYYGGLNLAETAEVLKISEPTVVRDWNMAKAWLAREIRK